MTTKNNTSNAVSMDLLKQFALTKGDNQFIPSHPLQKNITNVGNAKTNKPLNLMNLNQEMSQDQFRDMILNLQHQKMFNKEKNAAQVEEYEKMLKKVENDPEFINRGMKNIPERKIVDIKLPLPLENDKKGLDRYVNYNKLGEESRKELKLEANLKAQETAFLKLLKNDREEYERTQKDIKAAIDKHLTNRLARQIIRQRKNRIVIQVKNPLGEKPYFIARSPTKIQSYYIQYLQPAKHYEEDPNAPYIDETTNLVFRLRRTFFDYLREKLFGEVVIFDENMRKKYIVPQVTNVSRIKQLTAY